MSKILDTMKARYGSRKTAARRPSPARTPPARNEKSYDIEADTSIMPDVLAEAVCEAAAHLLDAPDVARDERLIKYLVDYANNVYSHNPRFRKKVRSEANQGNAGRDYLYMYMCHWISGELGKRGHSRRLLVDSGFSMGHLLTPSSITDARQRLA
jgi:hypothetical protein